MKNNTKTVKVWEDTIIMPTYETGKPDKNPMFLEKRVYQGSSGKVYPYPVIDKIGDVKTDKEYKALILENDYLKVTILPEIGGRIQRAIDKTNNYDFVYYNEVIKPALVGLTGPWVSGGIEFNWPQHHRPTTFCATDYVLEENPDGSKTVKIHEVDQMYGTKGSVIFTLYPDKAYIEIKGQVYNRTPLDQTFLWWANPAVDANDYTQSVFPPDVNAVMDHGKRAVSKFPIATSTYYKYDYGEGVDISRYKNIAVPTSYMAYHSDYDFVGGYDYSVEAGIIHVADHHISPGKKQWTWGNGDFGKAWDRHLTDDNGPYVELMTGMFTDNQPDFTWLKPFEEKTFVQYFMPYKKVGYVKNASIDIILGLEIENDSADVTIYGTHAQNIIIELINTEGKHFLQDTASVSPLDIYTSTVNIGKEKKYNLTLKVSDKNGTELLTYSPAKPEIRELPKPAQAAKLPNEITTNEELFLTGMHLEQYRHATYSPDDYYLEALKRDPHDIRNNIAYGNLILRRGLFEESGTYFRAAIKRLTWKSPNPYDGEAYCSLGLSLLYREEYTAAYDAFYKAIWNDAQQERAFYYLAAISSKQGKYAPAIDFLDKALVKNSHNIKVRGLKSALLSLVGKKDEALELIKENLAIDAFDYLSYIEGQKLNSSYSKTREKLMRNKASSYLVTAIDYAEFGLYEHAVEALEMCSDSSPMLKYYQGYYLSKTNNSSDALAAVKEASMRPSYLCFPNRLEEISILNFAIDSNPKDGKAPYYLGNLFYDKKQYIIAEKLWEKSVSIDDSFPTAWRNLSLSYYNKSNRKADARKSLEKAFALDPSDSRVFSELDQLYKKINLSIEKRFNLLEKNINLIEERDDLYTEYASLYNLQGKYQEAYDLIMKRKFHPWEGGEGKITSQYVHALVEMAKIEIENTNCKKAIEHLEKALVFPENLGEGKLAGNKDNDVHYWLGVCYDILGEKSEAIAQWKLATHGAEEPAGMLYYYDQPADMILYKGLAYRKLGEEKMAVTLFNKLINYGETHIFDDVIIDYFAVSLPDLLLFEDVLDERNISHCNYLIALGNYGLNHKQKAEEYFEKVISEDIFNLKAKTYLAMAQSE